MALASEQFVATKSASTLLVMFIPSHDRSGSEIDQEFWVEETFVVLGKLFGGATAYPKGRGVWRDDAQGGKLLFDEPVVFQCYTSEALIELHFETICQFCVRLGTEAKQGAVGIVIDRKYHEIAFPDNSSEG
jgi:hypothetical protein